jgi:predicted ester cyclase
VAEEDRVVYLGRMTGTHTANYLHIPPSGNKIDVLTIDDYRLENGKIVERWSMYNVMALMQQMGAIPAGPGGH